MRSHLLLSMLLISILLPVRASTILEVCPHPATNDAEYVKLYVDSNCTLSDGEGSMSITGKGIVYVAKSSEAFERTFGFKPNATFENGIALSNSGDEVMLLENGRMVDEFRYRRCYVDEVFFKRNGTWSFRFLNWSSFKPVKDHVHGVLIVTPANVRVDADLVVSYTIKDIGAVRARRYVLDGNPVGGVPSIERRLKNVTFLKSRDYRHFHWKFALKGDEVIITTENWGWDKKGYVVEFESHKVAELLRSAVKHDEIFSIGTDDVRYRDWRRGGEKSVGIGRRCEFDAMVEVFVLPDTDPIYDFVRSAKRRLIVQAPYITDPKLISLIGEVAKNVSTIVITERPVKIDHATVRIERNLHGKMIVADDRVLITTANFDFSGLRMNREVAMIIYDKKVADFLCGGSDDELIFAIALMGVAIAIIYKKMGG